MEMNASSGVAYILSTHTCPGEKRIKARVNNTEYKKWLL
jgi:hypothetical protein